MVRTCSRYWADPSAEFISMSPECAQNRCHHALLAAASERSERRAAPPSMRRAVARALPPAQCGAATTTRNDPFASGLKLTCTDSGLVTLARTSRPFAVTAASDPNVSPEPVTG